MLRRKCQKKPSAVYKMQETAWAAWAPPPDPAGRAYSAPSDPLADGEGAGSPLPKNLTPALGLSGLACLRPLIFKPPTN